MVRPNKRRPKGSYWLLYLPTYKSSNIKCGKLPAKVAEEMPWKKIYVDLIDHIYLKDSHVIINRERNNFNP